MNIPIKTQEYVEFVDLCNSLKILEELKDIPIIDRQLGDMCGAPYKGHYVMFKTRLPEHGYVAWRDSRQERISRAIYKLLERDEILIHFTW